MAKYLDQTGLAHFWDNIKSRIGTASQEQVDTYLDNHPEATTTVQDDSLTTVKYKDGSVTDNKLVQKIGLTSALESITGTSSLSIEFIHDYYINTSGSTVNVNAPVSTSAYLSYAVVDCSAGDKFTITGRGAFSGRLWCFIDASGNSLSASEANASAVRQVITAPSNASKLVVNMQYNDTRILLTGDVSTPYVDAIAELHPTYVMQSLEWVDGGISAAGEPTESTTRKRTMTAAKLAAGTKIACSSGYKIGVFVYSDASMSSAKAIETNTIGNNYTSLTISHSGYVGIVLGRTDNASMTSMTSSDCDAVISIVGNLADVVSDNYSSIKEVKSAISNNVSITSAGELDDGYIYLAYSVGDTATLDVVDSDGWCHALFRVYTGDKFEYYGTGGSNPRCYGILDESLKVVSVASAGGIGRTIKMDIDISGYLIVNFERNSTLSFSYYGIGHRIPTDDEPVSFKRANVAYGRVPSSWYAAQVDTTYQSFDADTTAAEYHQAMNSLVTSNPDYVSVSELGVDQDNAEIYEYTLTTGNALTDGTSHKPKVLINASIQGSEKNASFAIYRLAYALCNHSLDNPILAYIHNNVELKINPISCPYGFDNFVYVNKSDVSLNRNFDTALWHLTSTTPSTEYSGPSPASELETQIIQSWIDDNTDAVAFIDFHTCGSAPQETGNWIYMNWVSIESGQDEYYNLLERAAISNIENESLYIPSEYSLSVDENTKLGNVTIGTGKSTAKRYAIEQGVLGVTFEGFAGFPGTGSEGTCTVEAQKACSELIANFIVALMDEISRTQ